MKAGKLPGLTPPQPTPIRTELIRIALYGGASAVLLIALLAGVHDKLVDEAYERGRQAGFKEADATLPARLTANQELANTACTTWWFNMTHKDRKLK